MDYSRQQTVHTQCFMQWALVLSIGALISTSSPAKAAHEIVLKQVLDSREAGENLLKSDAWQPWQAGFERSREGFICDNQSDTQIQRGVSQTVQLNQTRPEPILASAWSKAASVGGSRNSDYALYLDLVYTDGTPLWGQVDSWQVGTHDWEKAEVLIVPEKPVQSLSFHMLLRRHRGKALFRNPELRVIRPPSGAILFDGIPITQTTVAEPGFQLRDVAGQSDFVRLDGNGSALDITLTSTIQQIEEATYYDIHLTDQRGQDRAVTLIYSIPVSAQACRWLHDPRTSTPVEANREYVNAGQFSAGVNGRLSRYPFAAVTQDNQGTALGIDMAHPAFFRVGYHGGTEELFLAYDIGLTSEKPSAHLRFCRFDFDPQWEFRAALARYYTLFPDHFHTRIREQGLWMPFAKISQVTDWQDFGFAIKEGTNETAWDNQHGILTFRYTEPMTWWMRMDPALARTIPSALAEAQRLAEHEKDVRAQALLTSGFHDEQGQFSGRLENQPWCDGAVWSINSMPGLAGDITDFKLNWNAELRERLYGPQRKADLDGEYIDSSEGYVTDELNYRRDHFAAANTPLTFSRKTHQPAIFRGLIVFEYIRALADDIHAMDRLMMANSTPIHLCWLAPLLDVMGSETNWHPNRQWRPMSDADLLYRRALCKGKPYCFLMNTRFEDFSHSLVERYMKRCLAYGMFPGFFSHNASQGHYFSRPELYQRDRPLFKKYIPLCKQVAEAGWQPITRARADIEGIYVERFGDRYLTVFNDSGHGHSVTVRAEEDLESTFVEPVSGRSLTWQAGRLTLALKAEDVAVLTLSALAGP